MSAAPRIRIWTAPTLLGISAAIGLIAALLSNGIGDYLAWVALAIPVLVVLSCARRRRPNQNLTLGKNQ